jgi:hypothetical protein
MKINLHFLNENKFYTLYNSTLSTPTWFAVPIHQFSLLIFVKRCSFLNMRYLQKLVITDFFRCKTEGLNGLKGGRGVIRELILSHFLSSNHTFLSVCITRTYVAFMEKVKHGFHTWKGGNFKSAYQRELFFIIKEHKMCSHPHSLMPYVCQISMFCSKLLWMFHFSFISCYSFLRKSMFDFSVA